MIRNHSSHVCETWSLKMDSNGRVLLFELHCECRVSNTKVKQKVLVRDEKLADEIVNLCLMRHFEHLLRRPNQVEC